ncbi:hypothetical protein BDY19DRAFT_44791 [Irpex rosettiformis]|uniref:Uncharacterized protein n=1 Tax=Irpex rosettiformis TaxID=378272 RepID=A0ACB8UKF9_9APHY|nr:hypothetical protein BDY19DRAFT_44791 [Irpex rosettiformis]
MAEFQQVHSTTTAATEVATTYDPKPSLQYASTVALQMAAIGTVVSATQNALGSHSRGAFGVFTRTGSTIGIFGAMGFAFALTEAAVANQREKDDSLNGVAGGCAAGFLGGIRKRSLPGALAACAILGTAVGVFDYGGRKIAGTAGEETQEERRRKFFKQPPPSLYSSAEPTDSE